MIDVYNQDFTNKVVLEVGTGRGGTTLELAEAMSGYKSAKLISTDIYDGNFRKLREEIEQYNIDISFIKTDGCELEGIDNNSVDLLICNYTLCAINAKSGSETIALKRFKEVLKTGGKLYIEEEYPINFAANDMQQVWSRKWQLLRASNMLLGNLSYNEMEPQVLISLLNIIGFIEIKTENDISTISGEGCLDFFNYRFKKVLDKINNFQLVEGLREESLLLMKKAKEAGGMEIPMYKIAATKGQ